MNTAQLSKRQLQAQQTRINLLHAGRTIFLQNGFQKATMAQINKHAKTGYGTAYLYFANKDELFCELMETIMQKMYEIADRSFQPQTKAEAYEQITSQARGFLQSALEEKEMMQVLKEAAGVSPIVEEKWNKIRTRFIHGIAKDIQYVQQAGLAKTSANPSLIARSWFHMNEQIMWDLVLGHLTETIDEIADSLTDLYTNGLYVS
ncbi:TetR/AcrR family transcriptional regulator [Sporosarcina sp. HYO08]|uniref:TetR/AcrR family transcriptional regulator n=1 Tax=Sporosarcina sp. HYO08 TaxID=1759557 RepID=UPI000792CA4A|nr:TetR/AcrR family transcriptional regulator [Sporosarcina sp. HYO08]KXH84056.1 TetR family transcriptional regulator [Sporosarcina sp. HYO08]